MVTTLGSNRSQTKAAAPGIMATDHVSDVHDLQLELPLPVESNAKPMSEPQKEDQYQEKPSSKRHRRAKATVSSQIIQQIADKEGREEGFLLKIERRHVDSIRNARLILGNTSALESANAYDILIEMQRRQREIQNASSKKVGFIIADLFLHEESCEKLWQKA